MWSEYLRMIDAAASADSKLVLAFAQVQDDVGAALRLVDRLDGVVALAVRFPADALVGGQRRRGA